jgi:hypothetical protein
VDAGAITTAALTAALVVITGYYARQNKRMVDEMAASRELAVLPKLVLDFKMLGPTMGAINLSNVGPGPALDVEVTVRFEPLGGQEPARIERRWVANVMAPGQERQFLPVDDAGTLMDTETLASRFSRVRLSGTMRDALGNERVVADETSDLAHWRKLTGEAKVRWQADPEKRLAEALGKELSKPLVAMERRLTEIARGVARDQ